MLVFLADSVIRARVAYGAWLGQDKTNRAEEAQIDVIRIPVSKDLVQAVRYLSACFGRLSQRGQSVTGGSGDRARRRRQERVVANVRSMSQILDKVVQLESGSCRNDLNGEKAEVFGVKIMVTECRRLGGERNRRILSKPDDTEQDATNSRRASEETWSSQRNAAVRRVEKEELDC